MTASAAEKLERSRLPTLDAATVQAVIDLKRALHCVEDLGRVKVSQLSPLARDKHRQAVTTARWKLSETRLALDLLLKEDA